MLKRWALILCVAALAAGTVGAQGLYTERGANGMGAAVDVGFSAAGLESASISGGYSISGILDLGLRIEVEPGELQGSSSLDLAALGLFDIVVLKQSPTFPITLQIVSAYGVVTTRCVYLDLNHLTRQAFSYSFGAVIHRTFSITSFLGVEIALEGGYAARRITTASVGAAVTGYPRVDLEQTLDFGGRIGVLFHDRMGTTYRVGVDVTVDQDLAVRITPGVCIVAPSM